jgi:hypothetical protein
MLEMLKHDAQPLDMYFILHGGPVALGCKRQKCTSLSTTESEYIAACESTREAVWLNDYLLN